MNNNYWDLTSTATAVEMYKDGADLESIASALNRTTRSVLTKLVKEGVYHKEIATKRLKKEELVDSINGLLGTSLTSLKAMTHIDLTNLLESLKSALELRGNSTL